MIVMYNNTANGCCAIGTPAWLSYDTTIYRAQSRLFLSAVMINDGRIQLRDNHNGYCGDASGEASYSSRCKPSGKSTSNSVMGHCPQNAVIDSGGLGTIDY